MENMPSVTYHNNLQSTIANQLPGSIFGAKIEVNGTSVTNLPFFNSVEELAGDIIKKLDSGLNNVSVTIGDNTFVFVRDGQAEKGKTVVTIQSDINTKGNITTFDYDNLKLAQMTPDMVWIDADDTAVARTAYSPDIVVDSNLTQEAYGLLATGNKDVDKQRVALLVMALGITRVNALLGQQSKDSKVLASINSALDGLMVAIETGKVDGISSAWKDFVKKMHNLTPPPSTNDPWVINNRVIYNQGKNKNELEEMSPVFLLAFLEKVKSKGEENVGSWVVNLIYRNGSTKVPGLQKDAIKENGYDSTIFSNVFGEFLKSVDIDSMPAGTKVKFFTEEELMKRQNIIEASSEANRFWGNYKGLHNIYKQRFEALYPGKEYDNLSLINLFLLDMNRAGIITIEEMRDDQTWWFGKIFSDKDEDEKLESVAELVAKRIELELATEEKQSIEDIFTKEFSKEMLAKKEEIFAKEKKGLKSEVKVTLGELENHLKGSYQDFNYNSGLIQNNSNLVKKLTDIYYKVSTLSSKYFDRFQGESTVQVAQRVQAGIDFLANKIKSTTPLSQINIGELDDETRRGLLESMYRAVKPESQASKEAFENTFSSMNSEKFGGGGLQPPYSPT